MIDYFDDIFFLIRDAAQGANPSVAVAEETQKKPAEFPSVTVRETNNYPVSLDSAQREKFAAVQYRIRIYSNKEVGRRKEAMKIFQAIDRRLTASNFVRRSKSSKPELYHSSLLEIEATYEAVISEGGQIYTRG